MEGKSNIRSEMNMDLKKEFDVLHKKVLNAMNSAEVDYAVLGKMVGIQISLAQQIVREERSLNGENNYLLPPRM